MKHLNEKAMLVNFSVGVWEGRRLDKDVTKETIVRKHADSASGAWWTRALHKDCFKDIRVAASQARTAHARMTLPWDDSGTRILPSAMFLEYTKTMRSLEVKFNRAVSGLVEQYPERVEQAKKRLGELFKSEFYPPAREIRHRYSWGVEVLPLPTSSDFRIDLGNDETVEIKGQIEETVQRRVEAATQDLWERLFKAVTHMVDRLKKKDSIFKDSLIGNVREVADVLAKLNVTGDKRLEEMRVEVLDKLADRKPDEIRNNPTERKSTYKDAKTIAKKMQAYMGK